MQRSVLSVTVFLSLVCSTFPSWAICDEARLIRSITPVGFSYIQTPGYIPTAGESSSVSPALRGHFWMLENGDPTPHPAGAAEGIDNGSFPAVEGAGDGYYYGGWVQFGISQFAHLGYGAVIFSTWAIDLRIDGCSDDANSDCIGVLLNDQDIFGRGYFALITRRENSALNFELVRPANAPYDLIAVPKLAIDGSTRVDDFTVDLEVRGPSDADLEAGLYLDPSCQDFQAIVGYKVRAQIGASNTLRPVDRTRELWTDVTPGRGVIPLGESATVRVTCEEDSDVYLVTSLVFDSDFELGLVGRNSNRVACGPTLADPDELQPRKPRHKPGRKKGRLPVPVR